MTEQPHSESPQNRQSLLSWLAVPRPTMVKVALGLLTIEALAVIAYTVWGIADIVMGKVEYWAVSLALVACTALAGWLLAAITRGIGDRSPWVRGPALTIQILMVLVGVSMLQASLPAIGIPVLAFGALTFVVLCLPAVSNYIGFRELKQD
ncbi:hypothetical protein [Timonella senegalensis]|uniref:hypothetical protein n=1 Tax=Timonella senegalensis TaxID=1465825 RepID=UPI0028B1AE88|nr:hypothetical protein [Timonella senegalensis]